MNIGIVRVLMGQWRMPMKMAVRLLSVPGEIMLMLMVLIVAMGMRVFQCIVQVFVLVPLSEMEPHTQRHQGGGQPEQDVWHFRPENEGNHHTK